MDALKAGMTWAEVQTAIKTTDDYHLILRLAPRRTKKDKRKRGESDDRPVLRVVVQRIDKQQNTLLRMNIKDVGKEFPTLAATSRAIRNINTALGL